MVFAAALFVSSFGFAASVDIGNWEEVNTANVSTLSDGSSFTGLAKVQPVKVTWDNAESSPGSGDAECTVDISSRDELVFTDTNGETVPYELEEFDTSANVAWGWVYRGWDSDGSDQLTIGCGGGDGADYSMSGTGANPWGQTGVNVEMVQHLQCLTSAPVGQI